MDVNHYDKLIELIEVAIADKGYRLYKHKAGYHNNFGDFNKIGMQIIFEKEEENVPWT